MNIKIYISLAMLTLSLTCAGQIITLRGKVTNAKTGEIVPGASVISGSFGTSADGSGNFVFYVQQSVIEESGITVSSIGYQTTHLTDIIDNYNVKMAPNIKELKAVNILAGAEAIVQKAYRQISQNYIDKSFNVTGIQSMIHSIRDTFGYQYYYSTKAKIKLYMSPYKVLPIVTQVGLMEKEELLKSNPKAPKIHFINGYLLGPSHDYLHTGAALLRGNPATFTYRLNRKEMIEGRRVYVVNFFSKSNTIDAGILYIDTATYAFVKVLLNIYNVKDPKAIDLDKVSLSMQYRQYGDKWALSIVKYNSLANFKGYAVERADEFHTGTVTTENATQLPEKAIIEQRAVDDQAEPFKGFSPDDKRMPANIQFSADSSFKKIKVPVIADRIHRSPAG